MKTDKITPLIGIIALILSAAFSFNSIGNKIEDVAIAAVSSTPTAVTRSAMTPKPTATADPVLGAMTMSQRNAYRSAKSYLQFSAFSRDSLIRQLEYEKYSTADAAFAVDALDVNWAEQALKSAKSYLDYSAFSAKSLLRQLEYEKFSPEDAAYAVEHCGADWYAEAAKSAKTYLEFSSFSRDGLINQLLYEGFTTEEAEYGVSQAGY